MEINKEITTKEARALYKESKGRISESVSSFVTLKNIDKIYPSGNQAVTDFNLEIAKGEFVALVGPSGCGKSTTLRMIAGLEEITSGELYIDGILSNYLPSKERDIAMVFQSYALYPQLNVYDNIAFGLKLRKVDKDTIKEKVFAAAKILDLGSYLDRKPKELSGGQMQRVALGRAIVRDAKLFLMDEPLSNLDAKLRVSMRGEIVRIHEQLNATTIYVTHDQTEAMTMADKIVVMNKGFIQQIGAPMDIYANPNNLFVATFIGSPAMNLFTVKYDDGKLVFENGTIIEVDKSTQEAHDSFYQEKIKETNDLLENFESLNPKDISNYLLENNSHLPKTDKTEINQDKKKENVFIKIKNKFKKKSVSENENLNLEKTQLEELNAHFKECLTSSHDLTFGIRCEDIHISEDEKNAMDFNIEQIEILGSEFILYGKIGNYDAKIKIQGRCNFAPHTSIKVSLNILNSHLFDTTSGINILKNKNEAEKIQN